MKRIIKLIIVLTGCMLCSLFSFAEGTSSNPLGHTTIRVHTTGSRPNAPSRFSIECFYSANYIEFELPSSIEELSFYLYKGDFLVLYGTVDKIDNSCKLPNCSGTHSLVCVLDDGRILTAELYF